MRTLYKPIHRFFTGYYTILLVSLVLLFILRPYDRGGTYLAVWKGCLTVAFFSAVFNCKHQKHIRILSLILGIPTFVLTWVNLYDRNELLLIINAVFTVLFITCAAASILYDVILRAKVTLETLRGVICAYFMIAFAFAYMYYLIEFILPGTIHFEGRDVSIHVFNHFLSEMLYFSFVTLLSIGYGDIVPVSSIAQSFSIIEGVIGHFYVAILVARLVAVYSMREEKHLLLKEFEHKNL